MTSADCVKRTFEYFDYTLYKWFTVNITLNNFHPTLDSIFNVYFGLNNFVTFGTDLPYVLMPNIQEIITVIFL